MIERIKTKDGERWALVFDEHDTLEDIRGYANELLDMTIVASSSDIWQAAQSAYTWTLNLLRYFVQTADTVFKYEQQLEAKKRTK